MIIPWTKKWHLQFGVKTNIDFLPNFNRKSKFKLITKDKLRVQNFELEKDEKYD